MAKVYAFNPPTAGTHQDSSITNRGLGDYYGRLGMRRTDVDKRTRMMQKTGRDYLDVTQSYEQTKAKPGIPMRNMRDFDKL